MSTFSTSLAQYVSAYSCARLARGEPMSDMEIAGALLALLAQVLTHNSDPEYREAILATAHETLDALVSGSKAEVLN